MKKNLLLVIQVLVSLTILYVLYSNVNSEELIRGIERIGLYFFIIAFIINLLGVVLINVVQIYFHAYGSDRGDFARRFLFLLRTDLIFRFYSLLLPMAGSAALKVYRYQRRGIDVSRSIDLVLINKLLQVLSIFGFVTVIWAFQFQMKNFVSPLLLLSTFIGFIVCLIVLVLYLNYSNRMISFFLISISKKLSEQNKIRAFLDKVINKLNASSYKENRIFKFITVNSFIQSISILIVALSQYMLFISLDIDLGYESAVVLRCLVLGAMLIPISYAGMGFREVGTVGVLSLYGITFIEAMVVASVLLVFQLLISSLGAVLMIGERLFLNEK